MFIFEVLEPGDTQWQPSLCGRRFTTWHDAMNAAADYADVAFNFDVSETVGIRVIKL